jgi:hypothetical protein
VDPENNAKYNNLLLLLCVGRVWAKVYCRQRAGEDKEGTLALQTLSWLVETFNVYLSKCNPACHRCGASASLGKSRAKVCHAL